MADLSRRKFLAQASLSVAGGGVALAALGKLPIARSSASSRRARAAKQGPIVAHVRDAGTGEVAVMTGSKEVVFKDPELVDRLLGRA
ncbi:MAG TPA: hypothetical protein VF137_02445 [Candidatus Dormibacteraeota bacterium]